MKSKPRHLKIQKEELIRVNCEKSIELANENGFNYNDFDESNHRLSFYDANKSYRLDVYVTTMTIGVVSMLTRGDAVWYKNQTFADLKRIMILHNINKRKLTKGY